MYLQLQTDPNGGRVTDPDTEQNDVESDLVEGETRCKTLDDAQRDSSVVGGLNNVRLNMIVILANRIAYSGSITHVTVISLNTDETLSTVYVNIVQL